MNFKKPFNFIYAFILLWSISAGAHTYTLVEGKYEVIETGLEYNDLHTMTVLGEWLGNMAITNARR